MSVTAPSASVLNEQSVAVPTDIIWRFSVDQYHAMIQTGILTEDDPVELLEGWLVTKMSKNPKHTVVSNASGPSCLSKGSSLQVGTLTAQEPVDHG